MNKYLRNTKGEARRRPLLDATNIKLILLVLMLLVVVYCMIKARNPETWAWMGFENQPEKAANGKKAVEPPVQKNFSSDADVSVSPAIPNHETENAQKKIQDDSPFDIQLANLDRKIESVEQEFWQQVFDRLSDEQKRDFHSLLRFAAGTTTADDKQIEAYRLLVAGIDRWRQKYHGQLLEHVTSIPEDAADKKKSWSEILFQVQKNWSEDLKPGLSARLAGDRVDQSHRAVLQRIRQNFLQPVLQAVVDSTPVARTQDAVAWLMVWEQLQSIDPWIGSKDSTRSVSQVELSSQPSRFRGQWVEVEGSVRAAQRKPLKNHALGFDQFYVLWIRATGGATIPICVYALDLPAGFPPVTEKMTELDEPIVAQGIFFKIRSYEANGGWRECPLVLCQSFAWNPRATKAISSRGEMPSLPWMVSALVAMGILSAAFAFWVYRTTSTRRHRSQVEEKRIAGVVQQLATNPDVKTVGERLKEMADQQSMANEP
jgi:hypothetical protein